MAERYVYEKTQPEKTGFPIVSCTDLNTGIVVRTLLPSDVRSFAGFVAYAGAKFSRSRDGLIILAGEVEEGYSQGLLTPEGRLASIVDGLKHQSPGGMSHVAMLMEGVPMATAAAVIRDTVLYQADEEEGLIQVVLAMEKIPIATAAEVFRTTVEHDGQEASTRFIEFGSGNDLPELKTLLPEGVEIPTELNKDYQDLQRIALANYSGWFPRVFDALKKHFQIDENNKKEMEALTARSYDTVRGFLLSGFKTSMVFVTNATTMQQMLSNLEADRIPGEKQLADALLALLRPEKNIEGYVPEIKPLLKHTEANLRTKEEQIELKNFFNEQPGFKDLLAKKRQFSGLVENRCDLIGKNVTPTDRIVAQHILTIYPSLNFIDAASFAASLNDVQKAEIGRIIFSRRDRFYLPSIAASGGTIGLQMQIDYGIERDLGRHRAWERVSPIHETHVGLGEIGETGFTQAAYLREIPELGEIQKGMEADMNGFYKKRKKFLDELTKVAGQENADKVGMYLFPLAHQVDMIMNGDVRYMVHLEDIRIRPGAHIDARRMIAMANKQVAESDPLYRSLRYVDGKVLVDDRQQFIDRS